LSCYNEDMPGQKMTTARLILAIISTTLEEVAIVVIWRWLLPEFGIELPFSVLVGIMIVWAAFSVTLFVITTRILKKQTVVGLPTMVGSRGKVASSLAPEGLVRIKGELWGATSAEGDIDTGEEVEVLGEDGLKLIVRRMSDKKSIR
jgi:membrane-bound ClpP family serine protease